MSGKGQSSKWTGLSINTLCMGPERRRDRGGGERVRSLEQAVGSKTEKQSNIN